jgi:hypothetical protein
MRYVWIVLLMFTLPVYGTEKKHECPYHAEHQKAQLDKRGEIVMGFSQAKATHQFLLTEKGGNISVEAKDRFDSGTISGIRSHLQKVATAFGSGDYEMSKAIHLEEPPGTEKLRELKDQISFRYEEKEKGGVVKIESDNSEAIEAVRNFLRFQIHEHETKDPLKIDSH